MTIEVTLSVPDELYEQAHLLAEQTDRSVAEVLSTLLQDVVCLPAPHPQRALMQQEERWLAKVKESLLPQYENQYIAFFQGQVVDSDAAMDPLIKRIQRSHPDEVVLIKKLTRDEDPILEIRSPRLL
jgi:hypothetical protein